MFEKLKAVERWVLAVERLILIAALAVMVMVNIGLIVSRLIPAVRLGTYLDLMVGLMPWVALIGASMAVQANRHVGFVAVFALVGRRLKLVFLALSSAALVFFFCVLIYGGWALIDTQMTMGQSTPALGMPRWWISLSVPVGGALMLFHLLLRFPESVRQVLRGEEPKLDPGIGQ